MRGTWYSILSTSQGFGGLVTPLVLPGLIASHGWGIGFTGPAVIVLGICAVMALLLRDGPAEVAEATPTPTTATIGATTKAGEKVAGLKPAGPPALGLVAAMRALVVNKRYM